MQIIQRHARKPSTMFTRSKPMEHDLLHLVVRQHPAYVSLDLRYREPGGSIGAHSGVIAAWEAHRVNVLLDETCELVCAALLQHLSQLPLPLEPEGGPTGH